MNLFLFCISYDYSNICSFTGFLSLSITLCTSFCILGTGFVFNWIALEPKVGTWIIYAKSGPNFDEAEIDVIGEAQEGMIIFAEIDDSLPAFYGKIISITGYGAAQSHNIVISAIDPDGVEIEKDLTVVSTKEGAFLLKWTLPDDIIPGLYTIIAKDAVSEAKTTIQIN